MYRFLLMLFLVAARAAAQNTPTSGTAPGAEQKKIHLEGTILSLNGEAVRKATVRLGNMAQPGQMPGNYSESTDNDGKFVFEEVAPGRYVLSAEKAGFLTTRYGARSNTSPGTQLSLTSGVELKNLIVKMTPQGVVAGKVLDEDGDPVATSQVQVLRYAYTRGRRQLQLSGGAVTNDLGEFRFGNLAPGRYYISASDRRNTTMTPDRAGRPASGQEGNITTFYPNGTDATSAVPVDVMAGGEIRGLDIRLLRAKIYTVRGKAAGASDLPAPTMIFLSRKDNPGTFGLALASSGITQLRPDGTFEYRGIVPGTYVLQLLQGFGVNGSASGNFTGRLEVTVADANIDGLILPINAGPEITGTVKLEDGDIAVLLKPAQTSGGSGTSVLPLRFTIMLNETEGVAINLPNTQVKDDGTFQFNAVGASKYVLNANLLPQGTYLKSARFSGQDVTHAPIDTTSGAGGKLELVGCP